MERPATSLRGALRATKFAPGEFVAVDGRSILVAV